MGKPSPSTILQGHGNYCRTAPASHWERARRRLPVCGRHSEHPRDHHTYRPPPADTSEGQDTTLSQTDTYFDALSEMVFVPSPLDEGLITPYKEDPAAQEETRSGAVYDGRRYIVGLLYEDVSTNMSVHKSGSHSQVFQSNKVTVGCNEQKAPACDDTDHNLKNLSQPGENEKEAVRCPGI
jgi:hypothetical protein